MNEILKISFSELNKIFNGKSRLFEFLKMELSAREDFYVRHNFFVTRKTDEKVFSLEIRMSRILSVLKEEESYKLHLI